MENPVTPARGTQEPMIRLKHVSKTFTDGKDGVKALVDVNLDIMPGDIFGIIGFSGAGKSTLVRCINLLERPTDGSVFVAGQELTSLSAGRLRQARKSIGMIFQLFNLMRSRTVYDNVAFPLRGMHLSRAEKHRKVTELLRIVGLENRMNAYPGMLSGGQKQRVAIARALATKPRYLLCDEATSALDPTTTQSILSLLKEINRTMGVTVIVITHEMRVIDQICDRVAVIDRGQIAELGAVSQVFTNPQSKIARELILPGVSIAPVFTPGGKRIRLAFNGETTRHPVVASLIMECQAPVNIVSADIREIDGKIYGQTILELPADEASAERARAWLKQDGVSFEEV